MQATEPSASSSSDTTIESVPELVWHAIWVRLSYCSRQNVRIASRALRCRSDASLDAIYTGRHSPEAVCSLGSAAWRCETPLTNAGNACNSALCIGGAPSPNHSRVLPKTMQREIPAIPGTATSTAPTTSQPPVRFPQLRHLALAPPPARPAPCSSPNLPPYLHTFHAPGPAALLLAFLPAPQLSHLLLLDLPPTLSEADLRTIASRCPSLRSLHFVAPRTPAGRSLALPPLASLAACSQLRELSLDLGRSAVAGPAARRSLGALTQLTRLQLTVSDTGGEDEDAVDSLVRRRPAAARGLRDVGEDGEDAAAVAAAATGGLVGSLFRLAAAGLSSLELRLVGVGTVECALLRAVGAGAALYERQRSARAAAPAAEGCVGRSAYGGSTPMGVNDPQTLATSSSCGRSPLQHLCVRLLPNSSPDASAYGSGSGPMYGSTPPHALYSCTAPVSGGGTHGSAFPLASLSYGPHPLGAGSGGGVDGGVGGVAWLQPSESESLLGCLAALPALTSIEVPQLLLASGPHLHARLGSLTRLQHLRVGGVVAAGVAAPPAHGPHTPQRPSLPNLSMPISPGPFGPQAKTSRGATVGPLPSLRSLAIEAQAPYYVGGPSCVPWWSTHTALTSLYLALQYGCTASTDGDRAVAAAEQLAAPLAAVPRVRLVMTSRTGMGGQLQAQQEQYSVAGAVSSGGSAANVSGNSCHVSAFGRALTVLIGSLTRPSDAGTPAACWPRAHGQAANGGGAEGGPWDGRAGGGAIRQTRIASQPAVRHVEVHVDEPMELAAAAAGMWGGCGGASSSCGNSYCSRSGGSGCSAQGDVCQPACPVEGCSGSSPALDSLKLASGCGFATGRAAHASARAAAHQLCQVLVALVDSAPVHVACLCAAVPGLALLGAPVASIMTTGSGAAAPEEQPGAGCKPEPDGDVRHAGGVGTVRGSAAQGAAAWPFLELAEIAVARDVALCTGSLAPGERGQLLGALERLGVEVREGRCCGCGSDGVLHVM